MWHGRKSDLYLIFPARGICKGASTLRSSSTWHDVSYELYTLSLCADILFTRKSNSYIFYSGKVLNLLLISCMQRHHTTTQTDAHMFACARACTRRRARTHFSCRTQSLFMILVLLVMINLVQLSINCKQNVISLLLYGRICYHPGLQSPNHLLVLSLHNSNCAYNVLL